MLAGGGLAPARKLFGVFVRLFSAVEVAQRSYLLQAWLV
jgi:hypothetical protein